MSDEQRPRSPEEEWRAVVETAMGPEARELEEMTDEEVDRELRSSGIDAARLDREGKAMAERLLTPDAPDAPVQATVIPLPPRRLPRWPLLLVAAAFALAATTVVSVALLDRRPRFDVSPDRSHYDPGPLELAAKLRHEAEKACDLGEWQACVDGLDRARALDPAGDGTARVVWLRSAASAALAPAPRQEEEDAGRGGKKGK